MPSRKFQYDRQLKKWVETTPAGVKPLCDELTADAKRFENWGDGVQYKPSARFPYHSEEMGVSCDPVLMAEDIKHQQEILARHNIRTEYDELGRPILRDQAHLTAHAKVFGYYKRDAGYRDPTPDNFVESTHSRAAWDKRHRETKTDIRNRIHQYETDLGLPLTIFKD